MLSRTNFFLIAGLAFLASVCPAQQPESAAVIKTSTDTDKPQTASFPYIAEIAGTDVYIRSGPGTAYYFCGKLSAPARVVVTDEKYGWLQVLPPAGSFSWISKNYVKIDPENPNIGIVTGDSVRVWAGSDYVEPMRSSSLQVKLNEGDQVKLAGDNKEKGDYYKIVPPPGAHLWVNGQYARYVGPVPKPAPIVLPPKPEPAPEPKPEPKTKPAVEPDVREPVKTIPAKPVVVPKKPPAEAQRLKECYELAKQIEVELVKPIGEQNYSAIKKALNAVIDDPGAGKAKLYAEYQLDRIGRFELAMRVNDEVKRQDAQLEKLREQIRKRYSSKVATIPDPGKFVAIGRLRPSQIYTAKTGQKRYLIADDTGRINCYAVPAGDAAGVNVDKFMYRKVGLLGQAIKTPYSPVSLIKFTGIIDLESGSTIR
jgi:hypothetical protein